MALVIVDCFENPEMPKRLEKLTLIQIHNLVQIGLCDYLWYNYFNESETLERKTIKDLIASFERVQTQLRTATQHANNVSLLIEGVFTPLADGVTQLYKHEYPTIGRQQKFTEDYISRLRYDAIMAFVWQLDKEGITTYFTPNMEASAWAIRTFAENSLKKEHTTLKRYVRTKPIFWQPDPLIASLMGIKDEKGYILSEAKATVLAKSFGSLGKVLRASTDTLFQVPGIGKATANRISKVMG